jgi:hypothetical protein
MRSGALKLFVIVTLCVSARSHAATDIITREIRYEKPAVLVIDHLHLNTRWVAVYPSLGEMFDAAAKGETDPKRFMPDFLKGDDVEVQNCRMTYERGAIDLLIRSKVRFVAHRPSKLRIVGIFVGVSYLEGGALSGEESEEMLIFEDAGGRLLWFPDFGVPDDLPSALFWRLGSER